MQTKFSQRVMRYEESLMVIRSLDEQGVTKYDIYLSDGLSETPRKDLARVTLAAHCIEQAIKRGKGEAGLSHYQVRNWQGWHHHQTLSLVATWYLVRASHREKKWIPAITLPEIRDGIGMLLRAAHHCDTQTEISHDKTCRLHRNEEVRFYHYKPCNRLTHLRVNQRRKHRTVKPIGRCSFITQWSTGRWV